MSQMRTLAVTLAMLFVSAIARADSYGLVPIASDQNGAGFTYGIDDAGHAVVTYYVNCPVSYCYLTYTYSATQGVISSATSTTVPAFIYDNGTPCSPTVPGVYVERVGACNNGRYAFGGLAAGVTGAGIFVGPDPLSEIQSGDGSSFKLNAQGDFIFDNANRDEVLLAIDLGPQLAPEPSSFLLLGTGLAGLGATIRRRKLLSS